MSELIPFQFNNASIRVIHDDNGDIWFIAKEIADILEYSDAFEMTKRLDSEEVQNRQIAGYGNRGVNLINESGLYSSILSSNKPSAAAFKKWVTSEVLPSIRKTGSYTHTQLPNTPIADAILLAEAAARMLRMSETSKIRMLSAVGTNYGIRGNILPSYTDESLTRALGDLLKEHGSTSSAISVNPILCDLGFIERKTRRSSKGTSKSFWSLTEAGLEYGKNETSIQNPNETQPRWYVNKFAELYSLITNHIQNMLDT
jgi:prophage antirepressor-like protein